MAIKCSDAQIHPDKIEALVSGLIYSLGYVRDSGIEDTPRRVAKFYKEFLFQEEPKMTTFPNTDKYSQMVVVDSITFYSLCEHHMLPFFGKAHVAHVPKDRILGLSKFARWVRYKAAGLWTQEMLTEEIGKSLLDILNCKHLAVCMEAEHMCMSMRGVQVPGTVTTTSALYGDFLQDPATRSEFYQIIRGRK